MGIDQYGQSYHDLGKHPRQELLNRLGYKSASKMYIDKKDGSSKHIGYIISNYWITLHKVERMEK